MKKGEKTRHTILGCNTDHCIERGSTRSVAACVPLHSPVSNTAGRFGLSEYIWYTSSRPGRFRYPLGRKRLKERTPPVVIPVVSWTLQLSVSFLFVFDGTIVVSGFGDRVGGVQGREGW
jgi:hypothetical protein